MRAGRSGVRLIDRFETEGLGTRFAATVDGIGPADMSPVARTAKLAELATEEALAQSGFDAAATFPGKLILGLPPVHLEWPDRIVMARHMSAGSGTYDDLIRVASDPALRPSAVQLRHGEIADRLARKLRPSGMPITVSTACSSGATAIQIGVEAIRRGDVDTALIVGADATVSTESIVRFSLLMALSRRNDDPQTASRPFDKHRDGFVLGEGAGVLVLERADVAARRGAAVLGFVRGVGERLDAYHRVRQSPDAGPVAATMVAAIRDAGLQAEDIDYVNAHGTSTGENDRTECLGLQQVFGERTATLPVSSLKSMIGHTLSAAGAIEAAATILMLQHQTLLPTINYSTPDPKIPLDVVPNRARKATATHALSNSFGFGGQNVSMVLSRLP